ncbi:DUF6210 family protein [Lentzea sp. NPDC003310]|uniref:DUF6210 family protein n=1 Tax=Lentzea sp. NPDC003310 TaxID=3154447 RepID=UPI0033BD1D63
MTSKRYVSLNLDDTSGDWLYVVIEAETGVHYLLQYGGTACRQGDVQGYLVPLEEVSAELQALCTLFEVDYGGAGKWNHGWPEEERVKLREIVDTIEYNQVVRYGAAPHEYHEEQHPLRLDESRMREADEAWIPVITPDGPGILVWCNSD